MAKPPPSGKCVHCLREFDVLTWDHVLPKSWYPDSTPENLEKWQFPSCEACNRRLGKIEDELLFRLGLCIGPEEAEAAGIGDKALRSIRPEDARDDRDREAREARRKKIREELIEFAEPPGEGTFPNFGVQPHLEYGKYLGVLVSRVLLESLGEKLVRGITFLSEGELIYNDHRIQVNFIRADKIDEVQSVFPTSAEVSHRGPGFQVTRAKAEDDPISAVFRIEVWGRMNIHAVVYHKKYDMQVEAERRRRST